MLKVEGIDLGLALAAAKSANALVTAAQAKLSTPQPSICLKLPWFCQDRILPSAKYFCSKEIKHYPTKRLLKVALVLPVPHFN